MAQKTIVSSIFLAVVIGLLHFTHTISIGFFYALIVVSSPWKCCKIDIENIGLAT